MPAILVTGGLGFIGSCYVNYLLKELPADYTIIVYDCHTYAARSSRLVVDPRIQIVYSNLRNWGNLFNTLIDVEEIVHFAAYSHVPSSFINPLEFCEDNIIGTQTLLECCRIRGSIKRILVISTDEVYGPSSESETAKPFSEIDMLNPTNPYSASKAAAEIMALAYYKSYDLPIIVTRGNNVFGYDQHEEKLIPNVMKRLLCGQRINVEGDGYQRRGFLHTDDVVRAVECIRKNGTTGQIYNIGSTVEHNILQVVEIALACLGLSGPVDDWIVYVTDRPYQDRRYYVDTSKLNALGWAQQITLEEGIRMTFHKDQSLKMCPSI